MHLIYSYNDLTNDLTWFLICLLLCSVCLLLMSQTLLVAEENFELGRIQCFNDHADSILNLPIPNGTGINWTLPYEVSK